MRVTCEKGEHHSDHQANEGGGREDLEKGSPEAGRHGGRTAERVDVFGVHLVPVVHQPLRGLAFHESTPFLMGVDYGVTTFRGRLEAHNQTAARGPSHVAVMRVAMSNLVAANGRVRFHDDPYLCGVGSSGGGVFSSIKS